MPARHVGRPLRRLEDPKLVTGADPYVNDVRLQGALTMALVRSPHAHADLRSIDAAAARAMPGVVAVLTGADLNGEIGVIHTHLPAQAFDAMNRRGRPGARCTAAWRRASAQALWEGAAFDESGQLLTSTLMDYALPKSDDLIAFDNDHTRTPSPRTALGVKGIGESATNGSTPAVTNAVLDALAPLGIERLDPPLTPATVWAAIQHARPDGRR